MVFVWRFFDCISDGGVSHCGCCIDWQSGREWLNGWFASCWLLLLLCKRHFEDDAPKKQTGFGTIKNASLRAFRRSLASASICTEQQSAQIRLFSNKTGGGAEVLEVKGAEGNAYAFCLFAREGGGLHF